MVSTNSISTTITLPEIMDVVACTDLREQFRTALNSHSEIIVDAKNLGRIATAGIQLLLSAISYAQTQKSKITITSSSDVLNKACAELGVTDDIISSFDKEKTV